MSNIKLTIQYIGTNYNGYQKQPNGTTIQQHLEDAIKQITGVDTPTFASGRTDAGVHALGQVVNFVTDSTIEPSKWAVILNHQLPDDIRVISSELVSDDFNSRFSAKSKTYIYKIYTGKTLSVFDNDRVLHYSCELDINLLNKCCDIIKGEHDFSSFMSAGSNITDDTIRTIYDAHFDIDGGYYTFTIQGNGFLYNMVRIIIGTILEIAQGSKDISVFEELFKGNNRTLAGKTAKPYGLYLKQVQY